MAGQRPLGWEYPERIFWFQDWDFTTVTWEPRRMFENDEADEQWLIDWESEQAGPPEEPRAAAYYYVIRLTETILEREVKGTRRTAVIEDFWRRQRAILDLASRGQTLGEQFDAMHPVGPLSVYEPVNVKKGKQALGPDDIGWAKEYEEKILPIVQDVARRRGGREATISALLGEFPWLREPEALEASFEKPSRAAFVVLGAKYGISLGQTSRRVTSGREQLRKMMSQGDSA